MSGLSIGLEALNGYGNHSVSAGSMDEAYASAMESYSDTLEYFNYGEKLMVALDNVTAINKTVRRYGYTKSLESLIGNQISMEQTGTTTNNENKEIKRNLWEKIVDWFKKIWRHIMDFFAKLFKTRRGIMLILTDIKNAKKSYKVRDEDKTFDGYSKEALDKVPTLFDKISSEDAADKVLNAQTKNQSLKDTDIVGYAGSLLKALLAADAGERVVKKACQEGIREAQRGLNDPKADIDSAREKQKKMTKAMKAVTKITAGLFKSARAFIKYIKKS